MVVLDLDKAQCIEAESDRAQRSQFLAHAECIPAGELGPLVAPEPGQGPAQVVQGVGMLGLDGSAHRGDLLPFRQRAPQGQCLLVGSNGPAIQSLGAIQETQGV